jgi:predicted CopG family antitoxin
MASKTITITEDVYKILKELKGPDESFSELLLRLANQVNGQKLEKFFGAWDIDDEEITTINQQIESARKHHSVQTVKFD